MYSIRWIWRLSTCDEYYTTYILEMHVGLGLVQNPANITPSIQRHAIFNMDHSPPLMYARFLNVGVQFTAIKKC